MQDKLFLSVEIVVVAVLQVVFVDIVAVQKLAVVDIVAVPIDELGRPPLSV